MEQWQNRDTIAYNRMRGSDSAILLRQFDVRWRWVRLR
jgi:hypothetical protein